ncbi:MAG: 1-pyrroline-5-carboxylate dehydrogenase [Flammeovirgaceae bacterium]
MEQEVLEQTKAGSVLNLLRWVSSRKIKETFVAPTDYCYSFLEEK